jgi:hypothetical protein
VRPVYGGENEIAAAARVIALVQFLALASVNSLAGEIGMIFWTSVALIVAAPKPSWRASQVSYGQGGVLASP